jgi:hypothetical protein
MLEGEAGREGRVVWAVADTGILASRGGEEGGGEVICEVVGRV